MKHHIPEDTNLHIHEYENLKSQIPPCSLLQSQQDKTSRSLQDVSMYIFTLHGLTSQKTVFKLYYKASQLRRQSSNYITRRHSSEDSLQTILQGVTSQKSLQTIIQGVIAQKTVFKLYYKASQLRRQSPKCMALSEDSLQSILFRTMAERE